MIVTLRETTKKNARAGLARLQPGPHRRPAAGPARPRRGLPHDHDRGDAAGRRAARRVLPGRRRADGGLRLRLAASYGYVARDARGDASRPARAWSVRPRVSRARDPGHAPPHDGTSPCAPGSPRRRRPTWSCCRCCSRASCSASSSSPRVAAFTELHLTFLDRLVATIGVALNTIHGQPPHRGAAGPVAAAGPGAAGPVGRAAAHQRRAGGEGARC